MAFLKALILWPVAWITSSVMNCYISTHINSGINTCMYHLYMYVPSLYPISCTFTCTYHTYDLSPHF